MPTLRINFSGLCFFAFNQSLKGAGTAPTEANVLLQRLTRSRLVRNGREVLDQHFPLLELDMADWDPASTRRVTFQRFPVLNPARPRGVLLLNGDDLTILPDGLPTKTGALQLIRDKPANPSEPALTGQDKETMWWMATLDDAFPGKAKIDPIFVKNPPGPNQPILARVQLTDGKLTTDRLTDYSCTFAHPASASFNQRVAMEFKWEIPFQKKVEIAVNGAEKLVLSPANGNDVQIKIMNMEIDSFLGIPSAYGPRAEADFEIYMDLLPNLNPGDRTFLSRVSPGTPAAGAVSSCVPGGGSAS
jgi:hypothetical protein